MSSTTPEEVVASPHGNGSGDGKHAKGLRSIYFAITSRISCSSRESLDFFGEIWYFKALNGFKRVFGNNIFDMNGVYYKHKCELIPSIMKNQVAGRDCLLLFRKDNRCNRSISIFTTSNNRCRLTSIRSSMKNTIFDVGCRRLWWTLLKECRLVIVV